MKTFNTYYTDKDALSAYIKKCNIQQNSDILVQIFSSITDKTNLQTTIDDILELLPSAKIIGATTDGEILDKEVTTDQIVLSISEFFESSIKVSLEVNNSDSYQCGKNLAKKIIQDDTKAMILFADGLGIHGEVFLHGVKSIAKDTMLAGGMAGDAGKFVSTYVFTHEGIISNGAVGVSISSKKLHVKNGYSFFWQEIGKELEITKAENNRVYEIEGVSAVDTYKKYLGEEAAASLPAIGVEFPLIISRNGVKVARAALGKEEDGSLIFAGNLHEGDKVHFGYGNSNMILKESINTAESFNDTPVESIFIYSCMARRRFLEDAISLELCPLSKLAPTSGFFTYGEFFTSNDCELLNQTMTVLTLSENEEVNNSRREDIEAVSSLISEASATHKALSHLIEQTSKELKTTNENLEDLVDLKTQELQKKVEELEAASKVKSDFLASMSHEIRTPMNAILGFVDILRKDERDKQRQKQFNIIKNSGNTLLTVINDILDFSKIESGKMEFEKRKFATKKPFKEVGLLFFERAKEEGIDLKIIFDEDLPRFFVSDITRLKQVASNLVSNAIKFTDKGGSITIHTGFDTRKNELYFSVTDTGVGIDNNNLHKIFDAFTQEDSSTTRKFGGTGLGLSISAALIKQMGGTIHVQSQLNVGSQFSFFMPVSQEDEEIEEQDEKENVLTHKKYLNSKLEGKVLLVEDNKTNQLLVQMLLSNVDLEADVAHDGVEAVDMFRQNTYDIILMDENMPRMSGLEATHIIRLEEKQKELIATPIVALTANALSSDKEKFLSSGMDEFIPKPINNELFISILHKYLTCKLEQ